MGRLCSPERNKRARTEPGEFNYLGLVSPKSLQASWEKGETVLTSQRGTTAKSWNMKMMNKLSKKKEGTGVECVCVLTKRGAAGSQETMKLLESGLCEKNTGQNKMKNKVRSCNRLGSEYLCTFLFLRGLLCVYVRGLWLMLPKTRENREKLRGMKETEAESDCCYYYRDLAAVVDLILSPLSSAHRSRE